MPHSSSDVPPGCDPDAIVLRFPVAPEFAGQRLDVFIQGRIPRLSRTRAREIVEACGYRPDGRKRRPGERVRAFETVLLVRERFREPDTPVDFEVLYEDADLLAVDKPAGLPVHPTATYHRNTLTYQLRERYGQPAPQIAHRLDRETSGVIACGKHLDAERVLKQAFEGRRVSKTYLAIVDGYLDKNTGVVDVPIRRAVSGPHFLMEVGEDGTGPECYTEYRVEEERDGRSLVALFPKSGRQHQLRVHLSYLGHPIIGDKMYGKEGYAPFFESLEAGMTKDLLNRLGHERQALHAHKLSITHPGTGQPLTLVSELPADLRALWGRDTPQMPGQPPT